MLLYWISPRCDYLQLSHTADAVKHNSTSSRVLEYKIACCLCLVVFFLKLVWFSCASQMICYDTIRHFCLNIYLHHRLFRLASSWYICCLPTCPKNKSCEYKNKMERWKRGSEGRGGRWWKRRYFYLCREGVGSSIFWQFQAYRWYVNSPARSIRAPACIRTQDTKTERKHRKIKNKKCDLPAVAQSIAPRSKAAAFYFLLLFGCVMLWLVSCQE